MTPKQLREWLFQNSQTDQWWGAFDDVTEESAVTVDDIEERLKSGLYKKAQVLHVSQTELANPPWIEVKLQSLGPITPAATFLSHSEQERERTYHKRTQRNESSKSNFSGVRALGLFLMISGLASITFYLLFFGTSVDTGYGSVNNLGLMSDKQNGIIVGGILAVVGVLLGFMGKK
jgi:hypothetical protein